MYILTSLTETMVTITSVASVVVFDLHFEVDMSHFEMAIGCFTAVKQSCGT